MFREKKLLLLDRLVQLFLLLMLSVKMAILAMCEDRAQEKWSGQSPPTQLIHSSSLEYQGPIYPVHLQKDAGLSSRVAKSRVLQARAVLQERALKLAGLLVFILVAILDEVLPRGTIHIHFLLKTVIVT